MLFRRLLLVPTLCVVCLSAANVFAEKKSRSFTTRASGHTAQITVRAGQRLETQSPAPDSRTSEVLARPVITERSSAEPKSASSSIALEVLKEVTPKVSADVRTSLRRIARDGDVARRAAALEIYAQLVPGDAEDLQFFLASMRDDNPQIRLAATDAIASYKGSVSPAIRPLVQGLTDKDAGVRLATAKTLGTRATDYPEILDGLISASSDSDARVRLAARDAIENTRAAAEKIGIFPISLLNYSDARIREATIRGIATQGTRDQEILGRLIDALDDTDGGVRSAALDAMVSMHLKMEKLLPNLTKLIRDPNANVRIVAVQQIAKLGDGAKAALPDLMRAIADPQLRKGAVLDEMFSAVVSIRPTVEEVLPDLKRGLSDSEARVRAGSAMIVSGLLGDKRPLLPLLRTNLKSSDMGVKFFSAAAVASMGVEARESRPELALLLLDQNEVLQSAAVDALEAIGIRGSGAVNNSKGTEQTAMARPKKLSDLFPES